MNIPVVYIRMEDYTLAAIDDRLASVLGFSWLYSWGMYLFLLGTLAALIWVFFDSIVKHRDQQALVPRILSMVGVFLIIPAFIFRFTGNADGVYKQVVTADGIYPAPLNWNVNWLAAGYGPTIAIIALLGVLLSLIALVIYASTVHRATLGTQYVNQINGQGAAIDNIERGLESIQRQMSQQQAATPTPTPMPSYPSTPSAATGAHGTIMSNAPQSATIIDLPKSGDTLTVQDGNGRGTIYDLPMDDVIIGRDPSCFVVLGDQKVSTKHVRLMYAGGAWSLLDLGSTNGTYVNGQRATSGQIAIHDGASIKLGDTVLVFRQGR